MENEFNVTGVKCNCCGSDRFDCNESVYVYPDGTQQVIHYCKNCFDKIMDKENFRSVNIIVDDFQLSMIEMIVKKDFLYFGSFINKAIDSFLYNLNKKISDEENIITFRGWLNTPAKNTHYNVLTILFSKECYEKLSKLIKRIFFTTDISFFLKLVILKYMDDYNL